MIRAIIYNTSTGKIKCVHRNDENLIQYRVEEGESWIESYEDVDGKYVVDGVLTPRPQAELDAEELEHAWNKLRIRRRSLLRDTDWTQVPDAPVDAAAWATYRQQLRDLPANTTDPRNVVWPVPPS
jgi:hypothetical protein